MKRLILLCLTLLTSIQVHAQTDTGNLHSPQQVWQLGRGTAVTLDWHPDGDVLAVGGSLGIWLYDENLGDIAHFHEAGSVRWLAWSPSGDQLATADLDETITLWDVNLDSYLFSLNRSWTFSDDSYAPRFFWAPEGDRLAVITSDNAQVLDVNTGEMLLSIPDIEFTLAWHPDGTQIAGVVDLGEDTGEQVRVWDAATGATVNTYTGAEPYLFWSDIEWSPDGSELVGITSIPATIHAWSAETGTLLNDGNTFAGEFSAFTGMWWLEDGQQIATLSRYVSPPAYSAFDVWDAETWIRLDGGFTFGNIRSSAKHPNDDVWALLTSDSQVMIWDIEELEPRHVLSIHGQPPRILAWSSDNQYLAVASSPGESVTIWDVTTPDQPESQIATIPYEGWILDELRWGLNDRTLQGFLLIPEITAPGAFPTAFIVEWRAQTGEFLGTIHETPGYVSRNDSETYLPRYVWSNDLSRVITQIADVPLTISTVSHENGFLSPDQEITAVDVKGNVSEMVWSSDSRLIAVISRDPQGKTSAWVYHAETGELVNRIRPSYCTELSAISWSPDDSMVALAGRRGNAGSNQTEYCLDILEVVLSSDEAALITTVLDTYTTPAHAWSPDSLAVAVGTSRGIGIYPIESAADVGAIPITTIPDTRAFSLAWSSDGRWLASGGEDATVRVWDVTNINR